MAWAWKRVPAILFAVAATAGQAGDAPGLLRSYCGQCHCDGASEGGLALDELLTTTAARGPAAEASPDQARWQAVWRNLRAGTMPPADEPRPTPGEHATLIRFIERDVFALDPARPDPGAVTLRRLNRVEYANTIRDLSGISFDASQIFPADDTGHGFDTIGAVLSMSPILMEKYLEAAATIAERIVAAMPTAENKPSVVFHAGGPPAAAKDRDAWLRRTLRRFAGRAFRRPVDAVTFNELMAIASESGGATIDRQLVAGFTAILAAPRFVFRIEPSPVGNDAGASPIAFGASPIAFSASPIDAGASPIAFGASPIDAGASPIAFGASPIDAGASPIAFGASPIDDWSLASRLSYFLWSSMPDDRLFSLAAKGLLRDRLTEQVDRMIDDPKSDAFAHNFVGQWLQTRDVEALPVDLRKVLGDSDRSRAEKVFQGNVRRAMRQQTELQFTHVLRENLPATDLLVGDVTFLNEPLARFYGIEGVEGDTMRPVTLPGDRSRAGLLTHGSFLLVTSNPSRTSPVKRGLFILENLLGTPTPPAPANVPPLEASAQAEHRAAPMRQLMERHRGDPLCASCHARMDPLGLALEHYNAIGQWRDDDHGSPIDSAGRLVTGEHFADADALAKIIAGPRRIDFHRCLADKMLIYALGRGLEYFDTPAVDRIVAALDRDGGMRALVHGVASSVPFTTVRGPHHDTSPLEASP